MGLCVKIVLLKFFIRACAYSRDGRLESGSDTRQLADSLQLSVSDRTVAEFKLQAWRGLKSGTVSFTPISSACFYPIIRLHMVCVIVVWTRADQYRLYGRNHRHHELYS